MPAPRRAYRPRPKQKLSDDTVEQRPGEYLIWTDGACKGNPGPGGWAAIVVPPAESGGSAVELSGGDPATTNNRMEYTGVLEGLRSLPEGSTVAIVTDSQLVLNSMTKWLAGWKRNGWQTASKQPVKNQDLVVALDHELGRHAAVRWLWVRGHETGDEHAHKAFNDRADQLAVAAAAAVA